MRKRMLKLKAQTPYSEWLTQINVEPEHLLKFGNQWIKDWEKEYGLSLRKPNKRFAIKKEELVIRLQYYLKNV